MMVTAIALRRDLPALLLILALPPMVFVVFTVVLREATTVAPKTSVSVLDVAGGSGGEAFVAALAKSGLRFLPQPRTEEDLRARVAAGAVDVGIIRRAPVSGKEVEPGFVVLAGHGEAVGLVQARLMRERRSELLGMPDPDVSPYLTVAPSHGDPVVLREVGAVSAMFLMFAAIQTAMMLVDERRSGIHERVACSDVSGLVIGKFGFGVLVGTAQAALTLLTATATFGVDAFAHPVWLVAACLLTASTATSLMLLVAAVCSTRHQAQAASTFAVLIASALGGSMVPSGSMPTGLALVGGLMPNAWMIRSFDAALGLAEDPSCPPYTAWAAMLGMSFIATLAAAWAVRRQTAA